MPGDTPAVPTEPKPLYPDVPWWAVLITALVCSVIAVVVTVFAMKSGVSASGVAVPSSVAGLAMDTMVYMPHIILLFGVLADMFTYDGVWSIPSLIGVLSIFLNYLFRYFWIGINEFGKSVMGVMSKGQPAAPVVTGGGKFSEMYDGCSVQGFESLASAYAPQTLVVTATVFSYYCFDIVNNRGWVNAAAAICAFFLTYAGQVGVIYMTSPNGCLPPPGEQPIGAMSQAVRALFEGLLFGGTSYGIVQTYYPTRLPSSTVSPFPRRSAADLTKGADGKMRDADGFPYIVLPNGQAVPDLSDMKSRTEFGKVAANALGSTPATVAGCSAATATTGDKLAQIRALATD